MHDPNFSRFVTIHSRYRQTTDRQTDRQTAELAMQLQRSAKDLWKKVDHSLYIVYYQYSTEKNCNV